MVYNEDEFTFSGVLAHEFQHMINFYQKVKDSPGASFSDEDWLNEGLSMYAEEICDFGISKGNVSVTLQVDGAIKNYKNMCLTNWDDDDINCYGMSYLFIRYLTLPGRYKATSEEVTRALVDSRGKFGEANVEAVTGEKFNVTLARWALSLFLNEYSSKSPDSYGIYDLNLKGKCNGVTFSAMEFENMNATDSIKVSGLQKNAFRYFGNTSLGKSTTFEFETGNQPVDLWFFDHRQ